MTGYESVYAADTILSAYLRAKKRSKDNRQIREFDRDLPKSILDLQESIQTVEVTPGKLLLLQIWEPKPRIVQAPSFKDKIIQNALCDSYLYDELTRCYIKDSYSSVKGKGTLYGLTRLSAMLEGYFDKHDTNRGWIWKGDIRHFFDSIRHDKAKALLERTVRDKRAYQLTCKYIDAYDAEMQDPGYAPKPFPPDGERYGIPLGLRQNQLIANLYLTPMDHRIKERYRVRYYGRYMDDFFAISDSRAELEALKGEVEQWLEEEWDLRTNEKSQIFPLRHGIDFLGFRTILHDDGSIERKLRLKSKQKMRARLKSYERLLLEDKMTVGDVTRSYQSWRGHAEHGDTQKLLKKFDGLYMDILRAKDEQMQMRAIDKYNEGVYEP